MPSYLARAALNPEAKASGTLPDTSKAVCTVRLTLLTRGVPTPCARIYRLPSKLPSSEPTTIPSPNPDSLLAQWVSLVPTKTSTQAQKTRKNALPRTVYTATNNSTTSSEEIQRRLAAELLLPPSENASKGDGYPEVPTEHDLIGFVTSGEYNLGQGKGVGIGSVLVSKIVEAEMEARSRGGEGRGLCVVRNAGEGMGRLARWEIV